MTVFPSYPVSCDTARPDGLEELAVTSETPHRLVAIVREPKGVVWRDGDSVSAHREDAFAPRANEPAVALVDEHGMIAPAEEVHAATRIDRNICDVPVRIASGQLFPSVDDIEARRPRDRHYAKATTSGRERASVL